MLSFTGSLKAFVCLEAMDMRKVFEGLHAAVGERLKEDVRSGALFVHKPANHASENPLL